MFILIDLVLLIPLAWMLRSMTGINLQKIALIILLSFPLHRNLLYGQFYILLLLLLVASCCSYLCGYRTLAGSLLAVAAVCKVFPALLFVFFLQRRDWRVLISGAVMGVVAVAISIAAFGWNANRTWLLEILPWVTRGEGLGTYAMTDSISGVLHRLFLSDPQGNPHPWHDSPLAYALLMPLIPMLLFVPVLWLLRREGSSTQRILLEWSALVTVALTVSTIPASYNFVLMIFPACTVVAVAHARRQKLLTAFLLLLYVAIGVPIPSTETLLHVLRLPLMVTMLLAICWLLREKERRPQKDWIRYAWVLCAVAGVLVGIPATWRQQVGERMEYRYRLGTQAEGFLYARPQAVEDGVEYSLFTTAGYSLILDGPRAARHLTAVRDPSDYLTFAAAPGRQLVERADGRGSNIVDLQNPSKVLISDARSPAFSADASDLAYLRDSNGSGELMYRPAFRTRDEEVALTPQNLNVYEFSFLSRSDYVFSATHDGGIPQIFLTDGFLHNAPIIRTASRYPALSPDGRWLAYSRLEHGVWNLWLRDQSTGQSSRIADVPCNQIEPSWEKGSKRIVYGTDCGTSLWFTSVARRRIVP